MKPLFLLLSALLLVFTACRRDDPSPIDPNQTCDESNQVISMYPNPATSVTNVGRLPQNTTWQISLIDALGRNVRSISALPNAENVTIPLDSLPSGLYIVVGTSSVCTWKKKLAIL